MMAAFAAVTMFVSLIPSLTYAVPAMAGLFIMVTLIEVGTKWSIGSYITASLILLVMPTDNESKMLFIVFFGYYPIIKAQVEKIKSRVVEYIIKFIVVNSAILVSYNILAGLLGIDMGNMGEFGKYTGIILIAVANVVFVIYDFAISRLSNFYILKFHKIVGKILNK